MKNKKRFWKTILIISLTACVLCLGFLAWYLYQDYQTQKRYEELQNTVEEPDDLDQTYDTGDAEGEEAELPDDIFLDMTNPVDFQKLQEINMDLYAWIRIPDTQIDYPIAQKEGDDGYYLHHDMYGESRFAGCIYTEDCNSKDFTDPNTVIYGHNMKNGSMFNGLHQFADSRFFEEHPYIYIYTPEHVLAYKVFAAYTYDDRHIMNSFDFTDKEVFEQYLDDIIHVRAMDANLREDVPVTSDDRIITLETCVGGNSDARYLVQGVLIKDGSNEQ